MAEQDTKPQAPGVRDRSPSFPFISLKTALSRLKEFEDYFKRHPAPAAKAGLAWDMKPNSSQAQQTLAALKAFGLIDYQGSGDQREAFVTADGRGYLRAQQESLRNEFIQKAALKPKVIEKYWNQWKPDRPPDPVCIDELVFKGGFTEASAATFLKVFDATLAYARLTVFDKEEPAESEQNLDPGAVKIKMPPPLVAPMRGNMSVMLSGDVIQVSAVLTDAEAVDKLIRVLEANKPLLPEKAPTKEEEKPVE